MEYRFDMYRGKNGVNFFCFVFFHNSVMDCFFMAYFFVFLTLEFFLNENLIKEK